MKKEKYITSICEFEKMYFPKAYRKKLEESLISEELGELLAKETLEQVQKILEK